MPRDEPFDFDDDDDEPSKQLRRWLGEFLPEEALKNIEDMME